MFLLEIILSVRRELVRVLDLSENIIFLCWQIIYVFRLTDGFAARTHV